MKKVVLTPKHDGTEYNIELVGDLAGILTIASGNKGKPDKGDPVIDQVKMMVEAHKEHQSSITSNHNNGVVTRQDMMVAGAGCHLIRLFQVSDHSTLRKLFNLLI